MNAIKADELQAYIEEHGFLFFVTQLYVLTGAEMDKTTDLLHKVTESLLLDSHDLQGVGDATMATLTSSSSPSAFSSSP